MTFVIRMAWRETQPALKRFLFLILAIALGVGALTGLKSFSASLHHSIFSSARDLIAADLAVRFNSLPNPQDVRAMESLELRGAELTRTTETLSMVSPVGASQAILSDIRAIDPQRYPFYGRVELNPPMPLNETLSDNAAVVSKDLLVRAGIRAGDEIQIGTGRFRIAAVLISEPDRIALGVNLGPRILITRKALERSGLIQFGSRASETFLYRLPAAGLSLDEARSILTEGASRRIRIVDYRNPNPSISRGLERATGFLSLIGMLALLVGGLGVSTTIHAYLLQKLDSIAIVKCLGGTSRQILGIYLIQGLMLGSLGSLVGIGLGYLVQLALPNLLKDFIELPTQLELAPGAALQGVCVGILTTLLFLLPPLIGIRKIRPARLFLREMPEARNSLLARLRRDPLPPASSLAIILGFGLIASWLAGSLRWGFGFLAALLASIFILVLAAKLLLALLKRAPQPASLAIRHGLKNLNRPGNQTVPVLVSLGLGVAFVLTIYFIQTSLISQIVKSAPADFPNVFMLGLTEQDKSKFLEFLDSQTGIESQALIPMVSSRLLRVDGKTADQHELDPHDRRHFQREFSLTWSESLPPDTRVIEGRWWRPPYNSPMISVGEEAAQRLKIRIGSMLEFDVAGRVLRGKVVNLRDIEYSRPGTNNQFIFSPSALESFPVSYIGAVRMPASQVAVFQSMLFQSFPNITSIDVGHVLAKIQDLLDKVSKVIQFIAFFAIASGLVILASSLVATRYQRIREAILLKTLGATRFKVSAIHAAEFLIIGSSAGLIGGILAAIAARYLLGNLLNTEFEFQWQVLMVGTAATAILAIVTGWLAGHGILNHKPLEILREN